MKIDKNGITKLASLGRKSLQIITSYKDEEETIDIPDNWFVKLNEKFQEVSEQEEGKYYLTQKGWQENQEEIKKAYEENLKYNPYSTEENTWESFLIYVDSHFQKVEEKPKPIKIRKN